MAYGLQQARRLVVFVVGITVLLLGIVLLIAPGPGLVTVAAGLVILATEFVWARQVLKRFRREGGKVRDLLFGSKWASRSTRCSRNRGGRKLRRILAFRQNRSTSVQGPGGDGNGGTQAARARP
jgi:Putative transmembrane protein (PGPGW)